jgi:hypothetical protein
MRTQTIPAEDKIDGTVTAKRMESRTGERWFVTVMRDRDNPNPDGSQPLVWHITNQMPYFGQWYDSDGTRHG